MPSYTRNAALASAIAGLLRQVPPGETVRYVDLSRAVSCDVVGKDRGPLNSARKALQRERIYFVPIRGVGLARLLPNEHADESSRRLKSVSENANRSRRLLEAVDIWELTPDEQSRLARHLGVWLAVGNAAKRLAKEVPPRQANPSSAASARESLRAIFLPPPDHRQ